MNEGNEAGGQEKDFFEVLVFLRKTKTSKPPYIMIIMWVQTMKSTFLNRFHVGI